MDKKLEALFDELNKEFWNGTLPKIEIKRSSFLQEQGDLGEYVSPDNAAEDIPKNYCIKIARNLYAKKSLRDTMLHEMVHHSQFIKNKEKYWKKKLSWHGVFWKDEMRRVGFGPKITKYT